MSRTYRLSSRKERIRRVSLLNCQILLSICLMQFFSLPFIFHFIIYIEMKFYSVWCLSSIYCVAPFMLTQNHVKIFAVFPLKPKFNLNSADINRTRHEIIFVIFFIFSLYKYLCALALSIYRISHLLINFFFFFHFQVSVKNLKFVVEATAPCQDQMQSYPTVGNILLLYEFIFPFFHLCC